MNRFMSLTTMVVLTAACVASATDFTVRIEPISPELIGPNSWVKYEITGLVENDGQNDGLSVAAAPARQSAARRQRPADDGPG